MKVQEWNCNRGNNLLISFLQALVTILFVQLQTKSM